MIRICAAIISLIGLCHFVFGIWVLCNADSIAQYCSSVDFDGESLYQKADIIEWRQSQYARATISIIIASTFLVSGIGLFGFKEWARKLWLASISNALIFQGFWMFSDGQILLPKILGWPDFYSTLVFFVLSWVYFTRSRVRNILTVKS